MSLFENLGLSGYNGRDGSLSIQMPTCSSCGWSRRTAHIGRRGMVRLGRENGGSSSSAGDKFRWKHIPKMITAAFGVFQGWKVVQKLQVASPEAGDWLMLSVKASKMLAKGLKVSHTVLTSKLTLKCTTAFKGVASFAKGLNTFYAAVKVVQFTKKGLGRQPQEGKSCDGDCIWEGYKVSKSVVHVLDPVVGKSGWAFVHAGKGFLVLKNTVGGVGVVAKAALLSRELYCAVLRKLAISRASGYTKNQMKMLVGRPHQCKPKRHSCMAISKVTDFRNLLFASLPHGPLDNDSLFSLIRLFDPLTEDAGSAFVKVWEEDYQSTFFCLAVPLPSSGIRV